MVAENIQWFAVDPVNGVITYTRPTSNVYGGLIYAANTNIATAPNWWQVSGSLTQICTSYNKCVGINTAGNMYFLNDHTTSAWVPVSRNINMSPRFYTVTANTDRGGADIQTFTGTPDQCKASASYITRRIITRVG